MKYKTNSLCVNAEQFFRDKKPWSICVMEYIDGTYLNGFPSRELVNEDWIVTTRYGKYVFPPEIFNMVFQPVKE